MKITCVQINFQRGWGGGENFTVFFTKALIQADVGTMLVVNPRNLEWRKRLPANCKLLPINNISNLAAALPKCERFWLLFHTPIDEITAKPLRMAGHYLSCIAHMPLNGRCPAYLQHYDLVCGVSRHVLTSMQRAGIKTIYNEPLLGVADIDMDNSNYSITAHSEYDWDHRKLRDRALSFLFPLLSLCKPPRRYSKISGITLGIVSRLTPIKQFPLLFKYLAPIIARHSRIHLEVFGAGGFASVRDLRSVLYPLGTRVRYWGFQKNVADAYRQIDYLMTGLPEKEALGLNVIEAQACGTPVLAVSAPPFTETIIDGITGLLYKDPRIDEGRSFESLLYRIESEPFRIDTDSLKAHMQDFTDTAFARRVGRLVEGVYEILQKTNNANRIEFS